MMRRFIERVFLEHNNLNESLLDSGLLKAFMLCGGPGAGKSYVVSKMIEDLDTKPKVVDSDQLFEAKLKKRGLSFKWADKDSEEYKKQWAAREESMESQVQILTNYLNGYFSVIIDGTGQNVAKTLRRKQAFEELGYDVMMIMVNTSIPVALDRNEKRTRTIAREVAIDIWEKVKENIPTYQQKFQNFIVVDNDPNKLNIPELTTKVKKFFNAPIQNPIGKEIIEHKDSGPTTRNIQTEV
jgi:adenylate kinase family enzyme